jgi:hypothetical protein
MQEPEFAVNRGSAQEGTLFETGADSEHEDTALVKR